jgi:hypothetical protein
LTSSGASPHSKPAGALGNGNQVVIVVSCLAALVSAAAWWCFKNGYILYYGDAESHLNISRGLIDSRTPGYDQLGSVWLPVLHLICLPFVGNDGLWSTGLAGTLPVSICFVVAGTCFYLAARESYRSAAAAAVVVTCFALNPNVLYLATIPMTEVVFFAGLSVALLAVLRFRTTQRRGWIVLMVLASWSLSLTRYDGWFLIPFIGLWLLGITRHRRVPLFLVFGAAASLAPLCWIAHNWWETGRALDFYNGPYSAIAIQKHQSYPGYQDWAGAIRYYFTAGQLCSGPELILLGAVGAIAAFSRQALQPLLFLSLTPIFYIWSMHSSGGTPIYVPSLWPFSYYNSRYGIAVALLCAFAAGAIVPALPARWKSFSILIPLIAVAPWLLHPSREHWICWKESQVNSVDRRAWTNAAVKFFRANYEKGQGILTSTGDVTGIYRRAGIHLSETLNVGNGPIWFLATMRPDLYHPNMWAVAQVGDGLSTSLLLRSAPYSQVQSISTSKFSPNLRILERSTP